MTAIIDFMCLFILGTILVGLFLGAVFTVIFAIVSGYNYIFKKKAPQTELTELEKLRIYDSLACTLFQHTPLRVLPTWFGCNEDDGYSAESYSIGWQNDEILAEIELTKKENTPEYMFLISVHRTYAAKYDRWEYYKIEDLLENMTSPVLIEFAEFINNTFK